MRGLPRETLPDVWVVNLAQHVDVRSVSNGQTFALMVLGFLFSLGIAVALFPPGVP